MTRAHQPGRSKPRGWESVAVAHRLTRHQDRPITICRSPPSHGGFNRSQHVDESRLTTPCTVPPNGESTRLRAPPSTRGSQPSFLGALLRRAGREPDAGGAKSDLTTLSDHDGSRGQSGLIPVHMENALSCPPRHTPASFVVRQSAHPHDRAHAGMLSWVLDG